MTTITGEQSAAASPPATIQHAPATRQERDLTAKIIVPDRRARRVPDVVASRGPYGHSRTRRPGIIAPGVVKL